MKRSAWFFLLICVVGCSSSNESGDPFSLDAVRQIHVGITDRATALRLMGAPKSRYDVGGMEMWSYRHVITGSQMHGVTFGSTSIEVHQQIVNIRLEKGIVTACSLLIQSGQTNVYNVTDIPTTTTDCDKE
jgi:hypothetical protein